MSYENILVEVSEGIATCTINRPKALNALNAGVLTDLTKAFREFRRDDSIKGIIITGSGDKSFVAGADIVAMKEMTAVQAIEFVELGHKCMRSIETCPKPVIAAVNGFALGGGLELALSCDFIYASSNAKVGLPEVNLGIFPGFGGTQRLPRLIGAGKAKELIFTAKMLNAAEGKEWGIINAVFEQPQLMEQVRATMKTILKKGPVAIQLVKRVVNEGTDLALASGLMLEESTFPVIFATNDKNEGVGAFIEKREAQFKGN